MELPGLIGCRRWQNLEGPKKALMKLSIFIVKGGKITFTMYKNPSYVPDSCVVIAVAQKKKFGKVLQLHKKVTLLSDDNQQYNNNAKVQTNFLHTTMNALF